MNFILASKSPRRIKLMQDINIKFKVIESEINENDINIQKPHTFCKKLAIKKSNYVFKKNKNSTVIGADTIVYFNKKIIGKPKNKKEAFSIIKSLSGKNHYVYTGVSIISKKINYSFYDKTKVTFYDLNDNLIDYYIENFNPYDKAGGYGIQDWSKIFIKEINGCYYNVTGLPIPKLFKILKDKIQLNNLINKKQ